MMGRRMFKVEAEGYTFEVQPVEDHIQFSLSMDGAARAIVLTRDEARQLHTDLGQMLDTFEVSGDDVGSLSEVLGKVPE